MAAHLLSLCYPLPFYVCVCVFNMRVCVYTIFYIIQKILWCNTTIRTQDFQMKSWRRYYIDQIGFYLLGTYYIFMLRTVSAAFYAETEFVEQPFNLYIFVRFSRSINGFAFFSAYCFIEIASKWLGWNLRDMTWFRIWDESIIMSNYCRQLSDGTPLKRCYGMADWPDTLQHWLDNLTTSINSIIHGN